MAPSTRSSCVSGARSTGKIEGAREDRGAREIARLELEAPRRHALARAQHHTNLVAHRGEQPERAVVLGESRRGSLLGDSIGEIAQLRGAAAERDRPVLEARVPIGRRDPEDRDRARVPDRCVGERDREIDVESWVSGIPNDHDRVPLRHRRAQLGKRRPSWSSSAGACGCQ